MKELTMLVQLAGGETNTVQQLEEAGFRSADDLVAAEPAKLRDAGDMTLAAAKRLIKAALKHVEEGGDSDGTAPLKKVLNDAGSGEKQPDESPPTATDEKTVAGVSVEETRSIAGVARAPGGRQGSFWNFG